MIAFDIPFALFFCCTSALLAQEPIKDAKDKSGFPQLVHNANESWVFNSNMIDARTDVRIVDVRERISVIVEPKERTAATRMVYFELRFDENSRVSPISSDNANPTSAGLFRGAGGENHVVGIIENYFQLSNMLKNEVTADEKIQNAARVGFLSVRSSTDYRVLEAYLDPGGSDDGLARFVKTPAGVRPVIFGDCDAPTAGGLRLCRLDVWDADHDTIIRLQISASKLDQAYSVVTSIIEFYISNAVK